MRCKRIVVLAMTVLTVGGCVSRTAGPDAPPATPTEPPTREDVQFANTVCGTVGQLRAEYARGREVLDAPTDTFAAMDATSFLNFIASSVSGYADQFDSLGESGIDAADEYVTDIATRLTRIAPEVEELAGDTFGLYQLPASELVARVEPIVELLESAQPGRLSELVKASPEFAAAYELAPGCEPLAPPSSSKTAPPPSNVPPSEAKDGDDIGACADGDCEVVLTGSATVDVGSFSIETTVADDELTMVERFDGGGLGSSTLGLGGSVVIGSGDEELTITLNGVDGDTAVVEFSLG